MSGLASLREPIFTERSTATRSRLREIPDRRYTIARNARGLYFSAESRSYSIRQVRNPSRAPPTLATAVREPRPVAPRPPAWLRGRTRTTWRRWTSVDRVDPVRAQRSLVRFPARVRGGRAPDPLPRGFRLQW